MNSLYLLVIILITTIMAGVGVYFSRTEKVGLDFLFPKRSLNVFASTTTLVASAAGVWILFTPVETTIQFGIIALSGYALGQALPLILIAIIGVRLILSLPHANSLPEWAEARYGKRMAYITLAVCTFYMFIFLTAELTAIGKAVSVLTEIPLTVTVPIIAITTWAYTNRGGFQAVVLTDKIQLITIIPLLILVLFITLSSSPNTGWQAEQLKIDYIPGWSFALTLMIAILVAQLFNQSLWQRAYAGRNERTMRISFLTAALIMIPLIYLAGSFGFLVQQAGITPTHAETGLFELINHLAPVWLIILLLIVAVLLVMSSLDSLLNALAGLVVQHMMSRHQHNQPAASPSNQASSLPPTQSTASPPSSSSTSTPTQATLSSSNQQQIIHLSRWMTSVLTLLAILIAIPGYSVLYLFLVADMLCASMAFPLFYGLYAKKVTEAGALFGAAAGIVSGVLFMPRPDFSPLIPHALGSSWLHSFLAALIMSCAFTLLITSLTKPTPKSKSASNSPSHNNKD